MKKRLITLLQFSIYWEIFFIIGKIFFICFNSSTVTNFSLPACLFSLLYGLKLDLSCIGYILIIPVLILVIDSLKQDLKTRLVFIIYNYGLITVFSLFIITDSVLYQHWGIKLDIEPFKYLSNPLLIIGNLSYISLVFQILFYLLFIVLSIWVFNKTVTFPIQSTQKSNLKSALGLFVLGANLLWPIRGGFDYQPKIQLGIPIQVSTVFFHQDIFYNHAAYNVPWYIGQSIIHLDKKSAQIKLVNKKTAKKEFEKIIKLNQRNDTIIFVNKTNPNIVLIILESFTANVIEPLGGKPGITPCFNQLTKEGILFSSCYATGTHSDKAMSGVFSGIPALPKTSVIEVPSKINQVNYFTQNLLKVGYSTEMIYGGDLNFGNFNLLFNEAGIQKIIGKSDFPTNQLLSKWGVPDEYTLEYLKEEIIESKQPFFKGIFTLSSHAPFDTPMEQVFEVNNKDDMFYNSIYYTDQQLGAFIESIKKTPVWENTLVIFIADHGVNYGSKEPRHHPSKFKIPMLWLGGALNKKGIVIDQTCSQTDLSTTLLNQLRIPHAPNVYSKDIFKSKGYAFYSYNNGFSFVTDSSITCYDLNANQFTLVDQPMDSLAGTYYMQYWVNEFNQLGAMK